ncbi:DUF418 domain-containing protein [Nocardiopsis flavescens]|uniref:Uncharacterized membrane protein YeiB n=1 Tax=Nocardiopsis flavescens TaxID=758803 RepID=A0A1M6MK49_9ACTN|nr:DUF418 domain-containing protein [Nocardiopsis flavescens]SHJ83776.1 Uncharacterized membrane protein YeiB [Nocardiopsis flavescens]
MDGRLLAPDFARGGMLLLIVLSNAAIFYHGVAAAGGGTSATPLADQAVRFAMLALLDVRVYPLFAFLVGYGLARAYAARSAELGEDRARAVIRSRNRWLLAFGAVHAALLMGSEVLAAYGIVGLVLCALFLGRSERRLRAAVLTGAGLLAAAFLVSAAVLAASALLPAAGTPPAAGPPPEELGLNGSGTADYPASVVSRLTGWGFLLFVNAFGVVMPTAVLAGMWTARRGILEEPHRHRRLVATAAAAGVGLGLAGALPSALAHVGVLEPASGAAEAALFLLAWTSGLAGGLGYAALFVLAADRFTRRGRTPRPVAAVAALGKRSLSGYLTHSLVMAPVLSLWGLGLAAHLTEATTALFALCLWLATVAAAALMERKGVRGPFEVLLRGLGARAARRRAGVPR